MYTIKYDRGNEFFDTYYIFDKDGKKIGIVEDHLRGVKIPYYVGWRLKPNCSMGIGQTKSFNSREDAIQYATENYEEKEEHCS